MIITNNITSLTNEHCGQIVNLILPIQQIEFNVPITLDGQPDLLDIERKYHKSGGNFWGAFTNGELTGTIGLIDTGHNTGAIRKMFVKKEFRGKEYGIAQQLLDTLLAYCNDHQIAKLYLGTVQQLKAAHRFYERNGFERINKAEMPTFFPFMQPDDTYYHIHLAN